MSEEKDGNEVKTAVMPDEASASEAESQDDLNPGFPFPSGSQETDPGEPPP